MKLPPDVSAANFSAAVKRFQSVVGPEWVFVSEEDVNLYRDAYTPFRNEPDEYIPSGGIGPNSVEQVQEIVRIANEFKIPLWPVSTGRNLGYGGAAPRMTGTMVLDLKRINRVLEVNDSLAYAIVEPGVSYFDFYRHLQDNHHKLWLDCPDPGWGSVIGNALEHGNGHTPFQDHFDFHCGMELVLANGEIMRTGMGALPNSPSWGTFKYGFGPHISPMFSQSNFGIVTKMGIWLMPEPEAVKNYLVSVPAKADLVPFVDTMASLMTRGITDTNWAIASPILTSQDPKIASLVASGAPTEELERAGREANLGYWGTRLRFYGPPEIIDAQWKYAWEHLSAAIPGATYKLAASFTFPMDRDSIEEPPDDVFGKTALGIPSLSIFSLGGATRRDGHIFFSPIIPMSGREMAKAQIIFPQAFRDLKMKPPEMVGGWSWFKRNLVLLMPMNISKDPAENKQMRENYHALIKVAAANGWGEYRTATAFMDHVMEQLSFNNHALRRYHETIKDAVDPNGILAPGKSGIWPKRYRESHT